MKPIHFPECNSGYVAAPGDEENVMPLPCFRGNNQNHEPIVVSRWELTKEEIEMIVKRGCIDVVIHGTTVHPFRLHTESVFSVIEEPDVLPTKLLDKDGNGH